MFQLFNYGEVGLKSQHIIKNAGFFLSEKKKKKIACIAFHFVKKTSVFYIVYSRRKILKLNSHEFPLLLKVGVSHCEPYLKTFY